MTVTFTSPILQPLTSGSISGALQQLLYQTASGGGQASIGDDQRNAMVFTSDLRAYLASPAGNTSYFSSISSFSVLPQSQNSQASTAQSNAAAVAALLNNQLAINDSQSITQVINNQTTVTDVTGQMAQALPQISMNLNPNSIEFDQDKRFEKQDTQAGSVFHHFTDDKGQNNDVLYIKFAGNTGNIFRSPTSADQAAKAQTRLTTWHNLYQLTREPSRLTNGQFNNQYVTYVSPLFPTPITFIGFWSRVLRFTEVAKKPNSRDYNMEFVVQSTTPDMNTLIKVIMDFVTQSVPSASLGG